MKGFHISNKAITIIAIVLWVLALSKTWTGAAYLLRQPSDTSVSFGLVLIAVFCLASAFYYKLVRIIQEHNSRNKGKENS